MIPQTNTEISNVLESNEMTSKTYKIDFENNRISEKIDGINALEQAIYCILNTIRYENVIYSRNYGSEIENAIGLDYDFAKSEIERYVSEAILADDRFIEIQNYTTSKLNSDSMTISFDVLTNMGVTINVKKEVGV